jgi:hypothetical protein
MSLADRIGKATHVRFRCDECGSPIEDGDRFSIVGVMSPGIRRGDIARTDIQMRTLGRLRCARCMEADTGPR